MTYYDTKQKESSITRFLHFRPVKLESTRPPQHLSGASVLQFVRCYAFLYILKDISKRHVLYGIITKYIDPLCIVSQIIYVIKDFASHMYILPLINPVFEKYNSNTLLTHIHIIAYFIQIPLLRRKQN